MGQAETIGIVGGGQLGRMLTEAAIKLGFKVIVVNPSPNSPAAQVGAKEIIGDLYDKKALESLAQNADFITVEIEHLDTSVLEELAGAGKKINPSPKTIRLIQDKLAQKKMLREAGLPVADFVEITDEASAKKALSDFGGRLLIKTRHGAYDGRGNEVVSNPEELKRALKTFDGQQLYGENFVPFKKELAVLVARNTDGQTTTYPVVETIQHRNICTTVLAPADISRAAAEKAKQVAVDAVNRLEGAGVFGIEMFLTEDGRVLINEIAPRVHNSGHYTIEACRTSQFEQHIRAISGLPLGPTDMIVPAAVMINILGERDGETKPEGIDKAAKDPHTKIHLYGKSPTKIDRKMGHITATGQTVEEARERAHKAREAISI